MKYAQIMSLDELIGWWAERESRIFREVYEKEIGPWPVPKKLVP